MKIEPRGLKIEIGPKDIPNGTYDAVWHKWDVTFDVEGRAVSFKIHTAAENVLICKVTVLDGVWSLVA